MVLWMFPRCYHITILLDYQRAWCVVVCLWDNTPKGTLAIELSRVVIPVAGFYIHIIS